MKFDFPDALAPKTVAACGGDVVEFFEGVGLLHKTGYLLDDVFLDEASVHQNLCLSRFD